MIGLRQLSPTIPASLVAVVLGVVAVKMLDLSADGVAIVGPIDSGLPSIGLPDGPELHHYLGSVASAAGIMLVGFAEGLGAAKTYAARAHYDIDTNRSLLRFSGRFPVKNVLDRDSKPNFGQMLTQSEPARRPSGPAAGRWRMALVGATVIVVPSTEAVPSTRRV